jgi:methionyl-tRNA synthetase
VFHAIIFPILLKNHGDFILPDNVPAYEFLNLEGDKFSTSRNWAVWLHEYLEAYPTKVDELKYVLTAIAPENKDSEFTWKEFQSRINNELAAIYGNFVNRTLVLTQKYYEGIIPAPNKFSAEDLHVLKELQEIPERISKNIYEYKLREAQAEMMNLARLGNKYLADQEPWKVIKIDEERVKTILYIAIQITAALSVASFPFIPDTSKKLQKMLNFSSENWTDLLQKEVLQAGNKIGEVEILFPKIEDELVENEVAKLQNTKN